MRAFVRRAFARSFRSMASAFRSSTPTNRPAKLARWLDALLDPKDFATYASFDAVADRLQKNNARLPRDKAEFLARHWAEPAPDGRVRLVSDPRHRLPFPTVYRIEETYAVWRSITAPALWVVGTESNIPQVAERASGGRGRNRRPGGRAAQADACPARPSGDDRRCRPHAASRSAGSRRGGDGGSWRIFDQGRMRARRHPAGAFSLAASASSGMEPASPDIAKLRIDRSLAPVRASRRRRWLWIGSFAAIAVALAAWYAAQPRTVAVQTTAVVTSYPSQQFVVLNATGYVVAQRKAAIASKATGRLEWLGVAEGSRVKAGEIIARLDNRDVVAQAQSAEANVRAVRAALAQAQAEDWEAATTLKRNEDLLAKGFVSQSAVDTAKARADRAVAGVANARAAIGVAEANASKRASRRRLHADPRAVRWRDRVEERERGRHGDAVFVGGRFQGRRRQHGRHEHARGRSRCVGVEPRQDQGWAAVRDHARCAARRPAFAAVSAAWCPPSTARRRR